MLKAKRTSKLAKVVFGGMVMTIAIALSMMSVTADTTPRDYVFETNGSSGNFYTPTRANGKTKNPAELYVNKTYSYCGFKEASIQKNSGGSWVSAGETKPVSNGSKVKFINNASAGENGRFRCKPDTTLAGRTIKGTYRYDT